MTEYNKKIILYANGITDSQYQDAQFISNEELNKIIININKELITQNLKFNNNIYSIRYLFYKFFNFLIDKKNLFKYVQGKQIFIHEQFEIKNISEKFKQNKEIVFECVHYNHIKVLLFVSNIENKFDIDDIKYKYFYHYCLKLSKNFINLNENLDYGIFKMHLLELIKTKKINIKSDDVIETNDDIKQELLEKIKKNQNKINLNLDIIKSNYDEYNIDKKSFNIENKVSLTLTEYYDGNYYNYLSQKLSDEKIYNSLVQIFIALIYFYAKEENKKIKINPENILYKSLDISIHKVFLYTINSKKYALNNLGYMFVIFNLEETNESYDACNCFLDILRHGLYKRYMYDGYNSLIVQLIQELKSRSHNINTILKIFNDNVKSFKEIHNN